MKRHITLAIMILLAIGAQATSTAHLKTTAARQGDSAYRAGNYAQAISLYEGVIAEGVTSADLHYNLAGAYYRTGQMGHAILNYERALRLAPSMSDARENLEIANSHTADRITPLPKIFLAAWYDALLTHISPSSWRLVVVILFAIVCAAAVVIVLARTIGWRKGAFATLVAAGLLLILAVIFLFASSARFNAHSQAIVLQPSITVKSSPELQSVDKLILHEGTKVTISEALADWYKVTLADGTTGWCQTSDIERI